VDVDYADSPLLLNGQIWTLERVARRRWQAAQARVIVSCEEIRDLCVHRVGLGACARSACIPATINSRVPIFHWPYGLTDRRDCTSLKEPELARSTIAVEIARMALLCE
jgi:hypothetical protein